MISGDTVCKIDQNMFYDFYKLAIVCKELDFEYKQLSADEFKVILRDDIDMTFINLVNDASSEKTMIEMESGHEHGVDFHLTWGYTSVHYLDLLLLLRTGEVLIYERYFKKILHYRWFIKFPDITKLFEDELGSGDEIHIIRL